MTLHSVFYDLGTPVEQLLFSFMEWFRTDGRWKGTV